MTTLIPRIQRVMFYSTCALALSALAGAANAHICMKKPYGQGYMPPMHPHHMQGYSGSMKGYGYPAPSYRAPAYRQGFSEDADATGQNQDAPTSSSTAPLVPIASAA